MNSRYLASSFMLCELLIVIGELVIYELINILTEFNGTLCGVVPAVPPREIITYELLRPRREGVVFTVYKALKSSLLELIKCLSSACGVRDVPNKVVKLADWALTAPGHKLNDLRRNTAKLVLEGLYVRAE